MSAAKSFYQMEIKRILSYRAEFWIGFLGSVFSQFAVAYFLWKAIYSARGAHSMAGFDFGTLMLYYLLVPLVGRVVHPQEMGSISGEIYDGGLSRYLVYPISYFRVKYLAHLAQATVYSLQLALGLALFLAVFRAPFAPHAAGLALAMPVLLLAGVLHFTMTSCMEMVAFWADNVWSILVLNRMVANLLGGGLIPLAFFPGWLQGGLGYLPFAQLTSFPVRCVLGQVGLRAWAVGLALTAAWSLAFWALSAWIWRRGLRGYTGVGI